jgi:nucleotide-binding universal stress UspA family protein
MPGIIVGIDGSGHSQRALTWAMKEAASHNAPLTVLAVHPAVVGYAGGPLKYPQDEEMTEKARAGAQAEADKALAALGDTRPPSVTVTAVHGVPADVFVEASKDAEQIVLGSRGVGGFSALLLGSVATRVAQHAHCPVTIIPPEQRS